MATTIPDDLTQIPASEGLLLLSRLWDSLDDADIGFGSAQAIELNRRLQHLETERAASIP